MNSALLGPLKSSRSGIALVGIATMLSLSSCSLFPNNNNESPEPSSSPSISASAEASAEAENAEENIPSEEATEGAEGSEEAPLEAPPEDLIKESGVPEGEGLEDIAVGIEEPGVEEIYVAPEEEPYIEGTEEEIPEVALETSAGESIESAESRYLEGMKKSNDPGFSDAKLLDIGYQTCEYYSQSVDKTEFYDKLTAASNGDHATEVMYVYAAGAVSITLCPEYETAFK